MTAGCRARDAGSIAHAADRAMQGVLFETAGGEPATLDNCPRVGFAATRAAAAGKDRPALPAYDLVPG